MRSTPAARRRGGGRIMVEKILQGFAKSRRSYEEEREEEGAARVSWGEARLRLGGLLGRPLASFYRWPSPLGRP